MRMIELGVEPCVELLFVSVAMMPMPPVVPSFSTTVRSGVAASGACRLGVASTTAPRLTTIEITPFTFSVVT